MGSAKKRRSGNSLIMIKKKTNTTSKNDAKEPHSGIAKKEGILICLKVKTTPLYKRVNEKSIFFEIIFHFSSI